jgi:hypothetical protein
MSLPNNISITTLIEDASKQKTKKEKQHHMQFHINIQAILKHHLKNLPPPLFSSPHGQ